MLLSGELPKIFLVKKRLSCLYKTFDLMSSGKSACVGAGDNSDGVESHFKSRGQLQLRLLPPGGQQHLKCGAVSARLI